MRLIDADKLERHEADTYGAVEDVVYAEDIDSAPTIDAVPVVRCFQCKHYAKSMMWCAHEEGLACPDKMDFCSYGERKEAEGK